MIRPAFIGIIFLAASLVCLGQGSPGNPSLIRARYQVSEKLYADAVSTLGNVQPSESDRMRFALAMGQALSGLSRFDEANQWLLQVTGEGSSEASYCLARNYATLNDFPAAVLYLGRHLADKNHYPEKQVRLDPAFDKLENSRDWIHLWQTDWYSAPEQLAAECGYLISREQTDEAGSLADQALTANPAEPHALILQARMKFLQKEDRQFRATLDKAWQSAAGNIRLMEEMLHFAMETGYYEKANAMASDLIRKDPTNPDYLISRALVRILDGKEALALKEIEATEEAGIAPAELYYQAGRKIAASMPQQAENYLNRAIGTGIMDARYFHTRGMVRNKLDKTGLALADLAMSLDIDPNQPDLYLERAQIRLDAGDTEGACHDWKKALEMGNSKAADLLYKHCRLP